MIRLGMHTDNLRELSGSFAAGVELGVKYELEHVECGFIDGIMYVQCMGYEPSVCTLENPRAIRRFVEDKGLRFSQLDAAFPLMDNVGTMYGVRYTQQGIRFASELGCTKVDTTDSARLEKGLTRDEAFNIAVKNYTEILKWAEDYKMIINIEPHGVLTNDAEFMLKLLSHFESEYLRFNMDTGNTYIAGNDPLEYLKELRKYLTHMHIKDVSPALAAAARGEETGIACSDVYIGQGVNADNIRKCIEYLKETDWEGEASIECKGTDENIKNSVQWLRSIINE